MVAHELRPKWHQVARRLHRECPGFRTVRRPDMIRIPFDIAVALAFLSVGLLTTPTAQAGSLTIQLTDGAIITCSEIAGANSNSLVLVSATENVRIERNLPWPQVAGAVLDGERYSPQELRTALGLPQMALQSADSFVWSPSLSNYVVPCDPCTICPVPFLLPLPPGRIIGVRPDPMTAYADASPSIYPNGIPATETPFALRLLRERRRIEAIAPFVGPAPFAPPLPAFPPAQLDAPTSGPLSQIEARVTPIRRNGVADINALGIELAGFDSNGLPVPVQGTAQFTLFALEQRLVNAFDNAYAPHPERLTRLAEWSRQVTVDASTIVRLPEPLPDHDPNISAVGSLRVRLNVPGAGVFEAISEPVTLRSPSLLRDVLRAETGTRFLPDEKTSGSPRQTWPRQPNFSSVD